MKIYYRQSSKDDAVASPFDKLNITNCFFMHTHTSSVKKDITPKAHHHQGFEIHILEKGHQKFKTKNKIYSIFTDDFLIIPPKISHQIISSTYETSRYSLSFASDGLKNINECYIGKFPKSLYENIRFITGEYPNRSTLSNTLIENRVFEITVTLLRLVGLSEEKVTVDINDDSRLLAVKEYIKDNIENPITVMDIANYCHLTPKQITRIFNKSEEKTPGQYIISQRAEHIARLLSDDSLSLKDISERMHFQNEYYFNTFVKKYLGMTPGSYRKMVK